ncbi:ribonuclease T [Achromatium sp. WMS1]|nr:ribonuclease T [Achromatium sp. WMS1]
MSNNLYSPAMGQRFRGFLPVVIDIETGGFDPKCHALLEIAAVILRLTADEQLEPAETFSCHVKPFLGSLLDPKALEFNGIIPDHPFRDAKPESEALEFIITPIRKAMKVSDCHRAILVGHNARFDLNFIKAAIVRTHFKHDPFHPFSTLDTVTLAAMAYGHTVLAKTIRLAGLDWNNNKAHSAIYDAQQTATLFCNILNKWQKFCTSNSTHPN